MSETRLALLQVDDDHGLLPLAAGLIGLGYLLVAPDKTKHVLDQAGLPAVAVTQLTGVPAFLGGAVETMHPAVHGGIVARRDRPQDLKTLRDFGVAPIDVVVVNLAPQAPGAAAQSTDAAAMALLRAAAGQAQDVWVLCDPQDYPAALAALPQGPAGRAARAALAEKALRYLAARDLAAAAALAGSGAVAPPPPTAAAEAPAPGGLQLRLDHATPLAGDASHPAAELWSDPGGAWVQAAPLRLLHGPPLTAGATLDIDAAWRALRDLPERLFCAVIAKNASPCGAAAMQMSLPAAVLRALDADPLAAAGAVIAVNRRVDLGASRALASRPWHTVVAVDFEDEALEFLREHPELRVVALGPLAAAGQVQRQLRATSLGIVVQPVDPSGAAPLQVGALPASTRTAPEESHRQAMALAWQLLGHVRANGVVIADDQGSVGIGAGQVSQADAAVIAAGKCRKGYKPLAAAFDAALASADALTPLLRAGVRAVIQPGGLPTDAAVIAAADAAGIAMVLTGQQRQRL